MVVFTYAIFFFSEIGENTEECFEKEMRDYFFLQELTYLCF